MDPLRAPRPRTRPRRPAPRFPICPECGERHDPAEDAGHPSTWPASADDHRWSLVDPSAA